MGIRMKKFGNFLWGLVLIIIGLIWGSNAIGLTNINIFFDGWWTLFIIVPCFIGIFTENEKAGNIIGLIIGVALLLSCRDILDFAMIWKLLIPVVLVVIGLSMIFRNTIGSKINDEIKRLNSNKKSDNEYCATFASQDVKFDNEEFKGTDLTAVFGGVKCDLRQAIINEDQVINCTSIFGGIELYVPTNVKIKVKSTPVFGGVSDKSSFNNKEDAHTIYVNAVSVFGGVDIK